MLKTMTPSRTRRAFGASILAVSVLTMGTVAWAAQPAPQTSVGVASEAEPVRGVSMIPPVYPKDAVDQKLEGTVILIVDVAADGTVSKAVVERSTLENKFDAAALDAVTRWKFIPEMKAGKAVAGRVRVPVEFRMDDPGATQG